MKRFPCTAHQISIISICSILFLTITLYYSLPTTIKMAHPETDSSKRVERTTMPLKRHTQSEINNAKQSKNPFLRTIATDLNISSLNQTKEQQEALQQMIQFQKSLERSTREAEIYWYRSNSIGIQYEKIDTPQLSAEKNWLIQSIELPSQQLEIHYYDGKKIKAYLRKYSRRSKKKQLIEKIDQIDGTITSIQYYRQDTALISKELIFQTSEANQNERNLYIYNENEELTQIKKYTFSGELLKTVHYTQDSIGRLIKWEEQRGASIQKIYDFNQLRASIRDSKEGKNSAKVEIYNPRKQKVMQASYQNGELKKRNHYIYQNHNSAKLIQIKTTQQVVKNTQIQETQKEAIYNENEQIIEQHCWEDQTLVDSIWYVYDSHRRLQTKRHKQWLKNILQKEEFSYRGNSHDPHTVQYWINENLQKIRTYYGFYAYSEKIYFKKNPIIQNLYQYNTLQSSQLLTPTEVLLPIEKQDIQ